MTAIEERRLAALHEAILSYRPSGVRPALYPLLKRAAYFSEFIYAGTTAVKEDDRDA